MGRGNPEEEVGVDPNDLDERFREYQLAYEEGRDIGQELGGRGGAESTRLAEMIRVHRELHALGSELGEKGAALEDTKQLGRFEILGSLGKTGLNRVLLAYDPG